MAMTIACAAGRLGLRRSPLVFHPQSPFVCESISVIPKSGISTSLILAAETRKFIIRPSRFAFRRFRRDFTFFLALGAIPLTAVTVYANVFIGPAQLAEIPEGYYPEEYEFYKHPIQRFFMKHVCFPYQKTYEQLLQLAAEEIEKARLNRTSQKIKALQQERQDYQGYMYRPGMTSMYAQKVRDITDIAHEERIDPLSSD